MKAKTILLTIGAVAVTGALWCVYKALENDEIVNDTIVDDVVNDEVGSADDIIAETEPTAA